MNNNENDYVNVRRLLKCLRIQFKLHDLTRTAYHTFENIWFRIHKLHTSNSCENLSEQINIALYCYIITSNQTVIEFYRS